MPDKQSGARVLVVLPHNLGDVIMATPVLDGLKALDPPALVHFLVEDGFEGAIERHPAIDELIRLPRRAIRDQLRSAQWLHGAALLRQLAAELNCRPFDRVINLAQHTYVSHLIALVNAGEICGQRFLREGNHAVPDSWSQYLYAIPFARRFNHLHAVDIYRRIAGVTQHRGGYSIQLLPSELRWAREYLAARGIDQSHRLMVFQPGAAYPSKRWPVESFIALGKLLLADGWRIIVTGAPAEAGLAQGVQSMLGGGCSVTAGETGFRESIALMACAQACVTADTAAMHAAAAQNVAVYALFGPTSPVETGPYGDGHWIFSGYCASRPCFCFNCRSMLCMKSIPAEIVYKCIAAGDAGGAPRCDVYRTKLAAGGDYRLVPETPDAFAYWDASGAILTRRLLEPDLAALPPDDESCQINAGETKQFIRVLQSAAHALRRFVERGDSNELRNFEKLREGLAELRGIGAFWTAMLNLRLNSIPLLDARAGTKATLAACMHTAAEVAGVLTRAVLYAARGAPSSIT